MSTTAKVSSTKIELTLNESNYMLWEFAMTDMLRDHGLLQYVLSKDELEVEDLSMATPTDEDYAKKKAKAASAISKNLGQDQIALILQHRGDPAADWKTLRNEYAGSSNQDVATMIMELNSLKLNATPSEEEAKSHFAKMTLLANKLAAIGDDHAIPSNSLATTMLLSLPDEFEPVKYSRLSGPSTGLTPQQVCNDVIACIKPRVAESGSSAIGPAALTSVNGGRRRCRGNPRSANNSDFRGKCWNCQRVLHRSSDCREKSGCRAGHGMIALVTALTGTSNGPRNGLCDFVVDGAASCGHVTTHLQHFYGNSYNPVTGSKPSIKGINTKADSVLVHGHGVIRLKRPDGSFIELQNVAYVPEASANLFSVNAALAQLEKAGDKDSEFREKMRSGKMVNGQGKVLVTSTRRGGLKYLDLHADQDF